MSAVVCSDINTSCLELKSAALTLMALMLKTTDLAQLAEGLSHRAGAMPGLFDDEPVVVALPRPTAWEWEWRQLSGARNITVWVPDAPGARKGR